MNHCLFKAKDTKGAVGNTVDYSSLTSYEWLFAQTTTLQNIFLREITEAKDLIDPQIFYMYAWISNIHCH